MSEGWKSRIVKSAIEKSQAETDSSGFTVGKRVVRRSDNIVCIIREIRGGVIKVQDSSDPENLKEASIHDFYDPQIAADAAYEGVKDRYPSKTRPSKDIN